MKTFKVKITSASSDYWYSNKIGEVFDVVDIGVDFYRVGNHKGRGINKNQCEIIKDKSEQFIFQGYPLEVGDKLYDVSKGWTSVAGIDPNIDYPITTTHNRRYKADGNELECRDTIQLYWDEPKFEIPKKPIPKIKKYLVVYKTDAGVYGITKHYYKSIDAYNVDNQGLGPRSPIAVQLILESEKEFNDE